MHKLDHQDLNFVGTPTGWRVVGYVGDNGIPVSAMVKMPSDWTIEVHCNETNHTCFCIGVSPDDTQVVAERWLNMHGPRRLEYADLSEQQAAMSGSDATTLDHAGILTELEGVLTAGDSPPAIPARTFNLTGVDDAHTVLTVATNTHQYGDLIFADGGGEARWTFKLAGRLRAMRTKGDPSDTRYVYKDGEQEIFFLYETGTDYLLEALRQWGGGWQRREVQVAQTSVTATVDTDIIQELEPQLVYDPNAFP